MSAAHRASFRSVCDYVLSLAPVSWPLLQEMIRIESTFMTACATPASADAITRIRQLHERAVTQFGADTLGMPLFVRTKSVAQPSHGVRLVYVGVWFEFMAFETRSGHFQRSNQLHARAMKTLQPALRTEFTTQQLSK